jgi:hypothetical protein
MPFHIESKGDEFEVVDDAGKSYGVHKTRQQAIDQQKALYAAVPEASKKEAEAVTEKAASDNPGDYLIVEDREKPTTWHLQVKRNGTPDHGLMGGAWAALHGGYRGNKYEGPQKGEALAKLKKLYDAEKIDQPETKEADEQPSALDRIMGFFKGARTTEKSISLDQYAQDIRRAWDAKHNQSAVYAQPAISYSYVRDVLDDSVVVDQDGKTTMYPYTRAEDGSIEFGEGQPVNATTTYQKADGSKTSLLLKEGRRHSSTDQDAIQQIHDLSMKAGADCALMVKEVNGKARWVLLSTNAYQDRDGEIVSRKAQNKDTERMNADQNFGPLRLWHLGYPDVEKKEAGPGVDIGDCDYSQMFGKVRVESGTFRNNRIAAAIKGRADQWATSVGFFHPIDEPDHDGVYHNIHTFERSLLPRSKAANALTPLAAIVKENSMTTKEEKISQLSELLGSKDLAAEVLKQADATEKQAQERGLKYKEQQAPAPVAEAAAETDKAKKDGGEPDEDDMDGMDEATAKAYKAMLPHIVKTIHALTKASNMEDAAAREAKAAKKEKKQKKLEARLKEVDEMKTKIDQIAAAVAELNGDVPRALQGGFRATQSDANLLDAGVVAALKQGQMPDPLGGFLQGMGLDQFNMKGGG